MRWCEVCTRSLGTVTARSRQESFRVYVHLDVEGGWLTGRPRLPGHLVAKLTCAGTVQPVWQQGGVPVSVGRALRIVPERTRRLVLDRDRGCRFPGCVARAHLEVHHVVHWAEGGRTDLANLAGLCPFHHDAHHRGEFSIGGDANTCGGLVFLARGGFPIGPGPIYAPTPLPDRRDRVAGVDDRCLDRAPGRSGPGQRAEQPRDLGYPDEGGDADEGVDPEPDEPAGLWPGVGPPVAYQGATGEKLHSKWVTFHEGQPLSM